MPKVYRVIEYDGPQEWIDVTLEKSIDGRYEIGGDRSITACTVPADFSVSLIDEKSVIYPVEAVMYELRRKIWKPKSHGGSQFLYRSQDQFTKSKRTLQNKNPDQEVTKPEDGPNNS